MSHPAIFIPLGRIHFAFKETLKRPCRALRLKFSSLVIPLNTVFSAADILQIYSIGRVIVIRLISVTDIDSEEMGEEERNNREHRLGHRKHCQGMDLVKGADTAQTQRARLEGGWGKMLVGGPKSW